MIMKGYFMKSSIALMVLSAALASCTQDEIVQNDVPTRQALNISVNTQDFVSEDGSRATTGTDAGVLQHSLKEMQWVCMSFPVMGL